MKKLFLIAPYQVDSDYTSKKEILKNLCSKRNLKLLVAENEKTTSSLSVLATVNLLKECDFAIADLSYERPSCYFEVGFLQALGKKVHLICKSYTHLHQVLQQDSLLKYSNLESYSLLIEKILKDEIYGR